MCLESSAGLTGIFIGVILSWCEIGQNINLTANRWALLATGTFALGFGLKDFVIGWRPLTLRRDPAHHSIIFTWR